MIPNGQVATSKAVSSTKGRFAFDGETFYVAPYFGDETCAIVDVPSDLMESAVAAKECKVIVRGLHYYRNLRRSPYFIITTEIQVLPEDADLPTLGDFK